MEIFVFLEMRGEPQDFEVHLLERKRDEMPTMGKSLSLSSTEEQVTKLAARNAKCFTSEDTFRLHQVIEATGYDKIVQIVREAFTSSVKKSVPPQVDKSPV